MKRMANRRRRAFTITELVIVIAVIAILAAVLIPTFIYVVEKANQSSDIQAVRNMNTALIADEGMNGKPDSVLDVLDVLNEAGMDAQDYKALSKDHKFIWSKTLNRVLYVDENYMISYPNEYEGVVYTEEEYGAAITLEKQIRRDDTWMTEDVVDSQDELIADKSTSAVWKDGDKIKGARVVLPGQLISVMDYLNQGVVFDESKNVAHPSSNEHKDFVFVLGADIDLSGAEVVPILYYDGDFYGNGHSISGIVMTDATQTSYQVEGGSENYYTYFGFISVFGGGTFQDVTLEVFMENPGIAGKGKDDPTSWNNHTVGGAIGGIYQNGTFGALNATVKNVTVKGSITSHSRIGGIVGFVGGLNGTSVEGSVAIENCINNAAITSLVDGGAGFSTAGGILGISIQTGSGFSLTLSGCKNTGTVEAVHAAGIMANQQTKGTVTIEKCTNSGKIVACITDAVEEEKKDSSDNTLTAGGIFGRSWSASGATISITGCTNTGTVTYVTRPEGATVTGYYMILGQMHALKAGDVTSVSLSGNTATTGAVDPPATSGNITVNTAV